jgi:hypothetical protein
MSNPSRKSIESERTEVVKSLAILHLNVSLLPPHLARNTADLSQITGRDYISLDTAEVELHGVTCMPWNRFLELIFFEADKSS